MNIIATITLPAAVTAGAGVGVAGGLSAGDGASAAEDIGRHDKSTACVEDKEYVYDHWKAL
jgi:hypothetical protein